MLILSPLRLGMVMQRLTAETKYKDWIGSVSADGHIRKRLEDIIQSSGLVDVNTETIIGIRFHQGYEAFGGKFIASALIARGRGAKFTNRNTPLQLRSVKVDVSVDQLLRACDSFDIIFISRAVEIEGQDLSEVENWG